MTLYLVRHGPTHQKTFCGHRDVPADLSDSAAIARLADFLPREALMISSDLVRARDTATAIARGQRRLADDAGLREIDFGDWDGRHFSDIAQSDPDLSRRYWEEPGDIAPPNGESWNAAAARVSAAVDALMIAAAECPLIVVAHMGAIMTQMQRALDGSATAAMSHRIDPLSVTEIMPGWALGRINFRP